MFRKIRSNRAPDRTVPVELYHEFRPYLILLRRRMVRQLKTYPKQVFVLMVILVIFSVLYSFDVLSLNDKKEVKAVVFINREKSSKPSYSINDGLSRISTTGAKLRKTLEIRKQVDSVLDRKTLNSADSAFLEAKLEELRKLR
ncbi:MULTISPECIES: hypothetical protein [unclassified Pedobacter]|uniref:hypothetical protein n=1 Tax=unclassified Pedobacter TaxID=2628915 RepID=UPI001D8861A8|nr:MULTISPECIES: hypothetical protein [unclassified Pedobacter]CAH0267612.1 hypothetical protein SRABI36_03642 [Pedobacter sp. Bi36]CAH0293766.1 hypothetical protein SRABI126_04136 [Pedobacter sp. Bi126]